MRAFKSLVLLVAIFTLSACGGAGLFQKDPASARPVDLTQMAPLTVSGWTITVPQTLMVSEVNSIKPRADIVWHGDPAGDRYAQVQSIMEEAVRRAAGTMNGSVPVTLAVDVVRFHALTPRLRYSFPGEHEIEFGLQVANAQTGEVIVPRYVVNATFMGFGGDQAVMAEAMGVTHKVRIIQQVEMRLVQELTGAPVANIAGFETMIAGSADGADPQGDTMDDADAG